jgi:hypothetical protein
MSEKTNQGNKRLHLVFAIAVLIGAIILLIAMERASKSPGDAPPPDAPQTGSTATPPSTSAASPFQEGATKAPGAPASVVEPGPTPVRAFFATPAAPPPPQERITLADDLLSPTADPRADLAIVASLFTTYADHFRELPVGNNAEITAALAGDNTRGLAVIPADHRAIDARGELVDRWGTPFFFHQLGAGTMQIRSAGPDRRMHTSDDLVAPPPEPPSADFVP